MEEQQPGIENIEEKIEPTMDIDSLLRELNELQFFADQTRFNAVMYQGLNILLEKVTKIEEKLNGQA